jgi:hypothetical protein
MATVSCLLLLSSAVPLTVAWYRLRGTSLLYAMGWVLLAWLGWAIVLGWAAITESPAMVGRYASLCLIACAGVAVLGARHPRAEAWNFVVLGLLAILLLPWMEGFLTGSNVELSGVRAVFLIGALSLIVINYLVTRLAPGAMLLGIGCGLELAALIYPPAQGQGWFMPWEVSAGLTFGLAPWAAWLSLGHRPKQASGVDAIWRDFRDRYGLAWAQLVREQFNRAAANAGYPVELSWSGLRATGDTSHQVAEPLDPATVESCRVLLESLLKRFGLLGKEAE